MMPRSMRAVILEQPGPQGRLALGEAPIPTPASDEVLIKVAHAGLNRADLFQRQARYPQPERTPPVPGLEVAGTIAGLGPNVNGWKVGDRVCALMAEGGYAEYCVAPATQLLPLPDELSTRDAAALPEALYTVWLSVFMEGALQPGERLLIHAGASGIGTIAIQMATALDATVYVTAGSEEKCQACRKLGATLAINYKTEDFVQILSETLGKEGIDVILDPVGGDYLQKNLNILRKNGRLISIGFLKGAKTEIQAGILLRNHLRWIGSTVRGRSREEKAIICNQLRDKIWPLVAQGRIRPVIDSEFPLAEAEKALIHMEQNLNLGKIVLHI